MPDPLLKDWKRIDTHTLECGEYKIVRLWWKMYDARTYLAIKPGPKGWTVLTDMGFDTADEAKAACERDLTDFQLAASPHA